MSPRRRVRLRACVPAVAVLALLGRAEARADARLREQIIQARERVAEIEMKLEHVKRRFPLEVDAAAVEASLRKLAKETELATPAVTPVRVAARPADPAPAGRVVLHSFDVAGRDEFGRVHFFVSMLRYAPGLIVVERLELRAAAGGTVSWRLRIGTPRYERPEAPAVPPHRPLAAATPEEARTEVERRELALLEDREHALQAEISRLAATVTTAVRNDVTFALGTLADVLDDSAVALTAVNVGREVTLEGVVIGAAARDALRPAATRAGLVVRELRLSPSGRCESFVLAATLPEVTSDFESPPFKGVGGNGLFDDRTAAVCAQPPDAVWPAVKVRGAGGPLDVHLSGVDVAEVFRVLHEATGEGFVLDADVSGRIDVDVTAATLDATLAALGASGMRVGAGPLREVSRAGRPRASGRTQEFTGEPVSVTISRAEVAALLRLLEEISGLPILIPRGAPGRVSVFARDTPWDRVLDGVIRAAGFSYVIDGNRLLAGPEEVLAGPGRAALVPAAEAGSPDTRRAWWTHAESGTR